MNNYIVMTGKTILERLQYASEQGANRKKGTLIDRQVAELINSIEEYAARTGEREYRYTSSDWDTRDLFDRLEQEGLNIELVETKRDTDVYKISW